MFECGSRITSMVMIVIIDISEHEEMGEYRVSAIDNRIIQSNPLWSWVADP